jgi:hypothetical protein
MSTYTFEFESNATVSVEFANGIVEEVAQFKFHSHAYEFAKWHSAHYSNDSRIVIRDENNSITLIFRRGFIADE